MPLLSIHQVSKRYTPNEQSAVKNISLQIEEGEKWSIVGESGSGKTTLLRLIGGLEYPDEGAIYFQDELVLPPNKKLIAGHPDIKIIFQDFRLLPNHKIEENIDYELHLLNPSIRKKKIKELLELCHLEDFIGKYPRELSGGQQQRVALAKALASEPSLLLMDEPFSNLDSILTEELHQIIYSLPINVILVSHDAQETLVISDKIVVMQKGEIKQIGTPEQIYLQPQSLYTARLFGQVNLISKLDLEKILKTTFFHTSPLACIRPEDLHLADKDETTIEGLILKVEFLGVFSQVKVKINDKINLIFFSYLHHLQIGTKIYLRLNQAKIIWLNNEF